MRMANLIRKLAICALACFFADGEVQAQSGARSDYQQSVPVGNSTREMRDVATKTIPFNQLTPAATTQIRSVVDNASYFRRLPSETINCDPEMFTFLVRNPEVMVGIWDVMGITRVTLNRIAQYQLAGDDGAGTTCKMDLIFGDDTTHIYAVTGSYKGNLWAKELIGNSIVLIHNSPAVQPNGSVSPTIQVTMDVFLKLENIGADLIVRTLGPLVNKSADSNFVECIAFVEQVSQVAANNPVGLQNLAGRLKGVDPHTRDQFIQTTKVIAARHGFTMQEPVAALSNPPLSNPTLSNPAGATQNRLTENSYRPSGYSSDGLPQIESVVRDTRGGVAEGMPTSGNSGVAPSGLPVSTGRPISTRRSQSARTSSGISAGSNPSGRLSDEQVIEPKGDSPTLYLLNQGSTP